MSEIKTENAGQKKNSKYGKQVIFDKRMSVRLYLLLFALVFAVCSLYAIIQMTNSRSVTVTINSASAPKGQNPDGSPFDIYEVLSDEVLESASEKLGGAVSVEELRRHLTVSDALTAKSNQQLEQSILEGENENTYFPTVYSITYSTVSDQISAENLGERLRAFLTGVSSSGMDRILEAVAESYQEYYKENYLTYNQMFLIDWESIDGMDYYNRAEALRTEATRIHRFLQDKSIGNRISGASSVKLSYGDLNNDLRQLIQDDIENHQAYIIQNNITTSREALLRQFRYMEEIHKEEKTRKMEAYLILNDAVDMYDSTTTKVVFIPALDQDDSFYMNRTKVGLDYLVEQADAARLAADEAEHNAQYYQYLQGCFADAVFPQQSQIDHADAVYENIKEQVNSIMESVKLLLAETNLRENEGIKVSKAAASVGMVGVVMSFAKRFVILSMAAYVLTCIPAAFSRRKKRPVSQEV